MALSRVSADGLLLPALEDKELLEALVSLLIFSPISVLNVPAFYPTLGMLCLLALCCQGWQWERPGIYDTFCSIKFLQGEHCIMGKLHLIILFSVIIEEV